MKQEPINWMVWSFEHRLKRRKPSREAQERKKATVQAVQEEAPGQGQGTFGLYREMQYTGRF